MANPFLLVVLVFLTIAGIAALVIYLLRPAKEEIPANDAINDSRISGQWAGGESNVHHVDFSGHHGGVDGGGHAG